MRRITTAIASMAALGLVAGSTTAIAATSPPQVPTAQAQAPSPWLMLSAMSSTRSIALAGANTAAQPNDAPPPPPPYAAGPVIGGEVIGIGIWFALIVIALTIKGDSGAPNSPA